MSLKRAQLLPVAVLLAPKNVQVSVGERDFFTRPLLRNSSVFDVNECDHVLAPKANEVMTSSIEMKTVARN